MVRIFGLACLCAVGSGARVKSTGAGASQLNVTVDANPICDSLWNPELDNYFQNKRVWGSGATACVYGGEDAGTTVAIKVGKPTENIAGWRSECAEQQLLRLKACQAGEAVLKLHQEFAPICTRVDQTKDKKTNYYVMHAGGTIAYRDLPKHNLNLDQKKNIFAQLVTSIQALHAVGWAHNDLHGQNIVLDKSYKLALIDFGSLKTLEEANVNGYKRDGNAIWRWGAVLFNCGVNSEWHPDPLNGKISKKDRLANAANFRNCLKNNGADDGTIQAVKKMTDACAAESQQQYVKGVYESAFVQSNLKPATKTHFPWKEADGCLSWSKAKMKDAEMKIEFGNHYKCETTPNWIKVKQRKPKADGTPRPPRKSPQCNVPELQSACITTQKNVNAACGGGLDMRLPCANLPVGTTGKNYDGACLKENHPAYKVAIDYPR